MWRRCWHRKMSTTPTTASVPFSPIADIDPSIARQHHGVVKRSLHTIVLGAALIAVACSNATPKRSDSSQAAAISTRVAPAIPLAGRVTDEAHLLSPDQRSKLSQKLEALDRTTKHQMAIATVRSLGGRDPADFTRDLANSWGIGRKGYNDGILLLVAPNERKVRIAVGYGLEATLTHEVCQEIIDKAMLPLLRKGDFPAAIEAGTDAVIARLE
jgi:uncharacterized protein